MVSSAFESHSWTVFWTSQLIILTSSPRDRVSAISGKVWTGHGDRMKGNHWTAITGLVETSGHICRRCEKPAACVLCQSLSELGAPGAIRDDFPLIFIYIYIYYSDTQKDRTDSIYQYLVGLDFSIFSVIAISQFNCTYQPYNLGYSTRVQTALEHTYWVSRNFRNHPGI